MTKKREVILKENLFSDAKKEKKAGHE